MPNPTVRVSWDPEEMAEYQAWASSPAARARMQGNTRRDTKPEMRVRRAVHSLGLRYRVDARPLLGLNRRADLVFTRARVAVFVDGCYWHGCPEHCVASKTNSRYWSEKIDANRARDADTDAQLKEAGWSVLRVWEHEDPRIAAQRIVALVGS